MDASVLSRPAHLRVTRGVGFWGKDGQVEKEVTFEESIHFEEFPMLNESEDILVLVDEAHRSHTRTLHRNLRKALPNAAIIGFTGTPILSNEKTETREIFGDFIDKYLLQDAELDGATVPILYEGRTAEGIVKDAHRMGARFYLALNAPSYQSAIRELVPAEDLLNAIALNSIQFNTSRVLGPSLAGFAIAGLGVAACFYLNALSYVPLLFVIGRVAFPARAERETRSVATEMAEGFSYIRENRTLLLLVVLVAMVSMFGLPYLVMMPAFARNVLHVGARGLGYLVAAAGTGALLGGIHLATMRTHRRRGPLVLAAALAFFAAILLFCVSGQPLLSALLLAVVGGAMVNCVATVLSLIQTLVPDQIRGRVLSMFTMAFLGFTPLGSLLVGALAERWGTPMALGLSSGFALALTAIIASAAPSVRHLK